MSSTINDMTNEELKAEYLKTKERIGMFEKELDRISPADSESLFEVGQLIDEEEIYLTEIAVEIADRYCDVKDSK